MNQEQLNALMEITRPGKEVSIDDLSDLTARTLLWGYMCDRQSFHVYLYKERLELIIYDFDKNLSLYMGGRKSIAADELIPDKRLYPEACDYEFCKLIIERRTASDLGLPFTTFNYNRLPARFHGAIHEHHKEENGIERAYWNRRP